MVVRWREQWKSYVQTKIMRVLTGFILSTGVVCSRNLFCGGTLVLRIMIILGEVAKRYMSFPFSGLLLCE